MIATEILNWIDSNLVNPPLLEADGGHITEGKPEPISSTLQDILKFCNPDNFIFWTPQLQLGLLVGCASSVSLRFSGQPLWVFHVGPPSSGKSLLNRAIGGHRMSVEISKVTGLMSGSDNIGSDIIHDINNHVWCCKDFTTMLDMPPAQLARFFGEARDAYDGFTSSKYLTGKSTRIDKVNFSCVLGVTHDIMSRDFTALGERFLKVDITSPMDGCDDDLIMNAMEENKQFHKEFDKNDPNEAARESSEATLRAMTAGFIDSLWNIPPSEVDIQWSKEAYQTVINCARFLSYSRTQSRTDRQGDLLYMPVHEVPRRTTRQLVKLANCLAVVQNKRNIDQDILNQVASVSLDSVYGFVRDILLNLFSELDNGLTTDELIAQTQIPKTTIDKRLKHLGTLNLVTQSRVKPAAGSKGNYRNCWFLAEKVRNWLRYVKEHTDIATLNPM